MRPLYVMLIGLPASGKTTLRQKIIDAFPLANWHVVSSDDHIDIAAANRGQTYSEIFQDVIGEATALMSANRAVSLAVRANIIHDQTNLTTKSRERKLADVPEDYIKIGLLCDAPEMQRRERMAARPGKPIPATVSAQMLADIAPPTTKEFDEIATAECWREFLAAYLPARPT